MTARIVAGDTKSYTKYKVTATWHEPHGTFYRLRHNSTGFTYSATIYRAEQLAIYNSLQCRARHHKPFTRNIINVRNHNRRGLQS